VNDTTEATNKTDPNITGLQIP